MKKTALFLILLFLPFSAFAATTANINIDVQDGTQGKIASENINDYNVDIRLNSDSSINVTEKIEYNFATVPDKHGIYRDIPINYKNRFGNFNLRISDISVTNENGIRIPFSRQKSGGQMSLKIGDKDLLVSGIKTYIISYRINRAVLFFDERDELYWNAIGENWQVPIKQAEVNVFLPSIMPVITINYTCFAGDLGTTQTCQKSGVIEKEPGQTQQVAYSNGQILPGQVFTVVLGLPSGIIQPISPIQNFSYYIYDNLILGLPLLVFFIALAYWYRRGRDPKGKGTIIAQFDVPNKLTPAQVSTILDGRVQNLDISAEIVYLATKGYIKIHQLSDQNFLDKFSKKDNYLLESLKDDYSALEKYQKRLLGSIFKQKNLATVEADGNKITGARLSKFEKDFAEDLKDVNKEIYELVVLNGYFTRNPQVARALMISFGAFAMFSSFFFMENLSFITLFSFFVSGGIILLFAYFMPQMTIKGVQNKEYLLGLKLYLSVAEKDRLEFHNSPEKKPETFEKLLPFAMVFKVEKQWAKQFEDIYNTSPDWYSGPSGARFTAIAFTDSLNSFKATSLGMMASTSRAASGGSGFSGGGGGGGFGGGGGGSW